jgi:signal recognition particle receptor subunit beta
MSHHAQTKVQKIIALVPAEKMDIELAWSVAKYRELGNTKTKKSAVIGRQIITASTARSTRLRVSAMALT